MIRTCFHPVVLALFCTANTAVAVFAQSIQVIGLDGKGVTVELAGLERRTVVTRRDGKPLLPDTGPWQIIVPNDRRAARWIRKVNKLEVRELK